MIRHRCYTIAALLFTRGKWSNGHVIRVSQFALTKPGAQFQRRSYLKVERGGGMGLWNNNFFQSQVQSTRAHTDLTAPRFQKINRLWRKF